METIKSIAKKNEGRLLPNTSKVKSQAAVRCLSRWKDGKAFLTMFNPDKQVSCMNNLRAVYFGSAPCLAVVEDAYGSTVAKAWLKIAIFDLGEFAGVREKMDERQIDTCAQMILQHWKYRTWNVCEFMRFFLLFKYGRFGKFYGSVDPIVIMSALEQFSVIRCTEIGKLEQEQQEAKEAAQRGGAITYEQWQAMKVSRGVSSG